MLSMAKSNISRIRIPQVLKPSLRAISRTKSPFRISSSQRMTNTSWFFCAYMVAVVVLPHPAPPTIQRTFLNSCASLRAYHISWKEFVSTSCHPVAAAAGVIWAMILRNISSLILSYLPLITALSVPADTPFKLAAAFFWLEYFAAYTRRASRISSFSFCVIVLFILY